MRQPLLLAITALAFPSILFGCNVKVTEQPPPVPPVEVDGGDAGSPVEAGPGPGHDAGSDASDGGPSADPAAHHVGALSKVDLLFMIDNSASMGDKQDILRSGVPDLLDRIVNPRCIDASGAVVGKSVNGACTTGKPEFPAVHDLHVGVVSSSLGGRGSDACAASATNPVDPALNAHNDDQAHLLQRGGADEHAVAGAASGFLSFAPGGDSTKLIADFQDLVGGVAQYGCGYEAQLESWYRFLVQPDPYASIAGGVQDPNGVASLVGVDDTVLKQRHDFLRPDSFLAVILLTDENDSTVDPLALGGQGWAYENANFPGSMTGGGAAKATSVCAANPNDPSCTSCGFCRNGSPAEVCNDPTCKAGAYYSPQEDSQNERFFHMKQRFGVDPQFPLERYTAGLSAAHVPDRNGEHPVDKNGVPSANYVGAANCRNPLFAASLPTSQADELCNLPPGPRALDQVLFAVIGGVPEDLVHFDPSVFDSTRLSDADWTKILGKDPIAYDFTGSDPRMLESTTARTGVAGDWATNGTDLEYACTFDLPAAKDCTLAQNKFACDCTNGATKPVCDPANASSQVKGKAYPTVRELSVARMLGDRAVVGSICALHATEQVTGDPLFGYRPTVRAIGDRISKVLATP